MTPTISVLPLTVLATATVAANRCVTSLGAYAAAGGSVLGVTRSSGVAGDLLPVDVLGTAEAEAAGVIAADAPVMVDATGRVVTHTGNNVKVGKALAAASAAGAFIEILLIPNS